MAGAASADAVTRVQAYCQQLQAILDAHGDEITSGAAKAISDKLMELHEKVPQWYAWQADPELERLDTLLREAEVEAAAEEAAGAAEEECSLGITFIF